MGTALTIPGEEGKPFFFEKKKQKTFENLRVMPKQSGANMQKFFGSFFQKRTLFLLSVIVKENLSGQTLTFFRSS
jgi:hypothetical protein